MRVALARRQHQGGPLVEINCIYVNPVFQKPSELRGRVDAYGQFAQDVSGVGVCEFELEPRKLCTKHFRDLILLVSHGVIESGVAVFVFDRHVRPALNQVLHDVHVTFGGGDVQRSAPLDVGVVDRNVRGALQNLLHLSSVPLEGGRVQHVQEPPLPLHQERLELSRGRDRHFTVVLLRFRIHRGLVALVPVASPHIFHRFVRQFRLQRPLAHALVLARLRLRALLRAAISGRGLARGGGV
mmetsp:Transcript_40463/g.95050  ORF Transcript_40463/g.95050 Transcript_40463/m.95050 type:complete len:241 (+) Transcript_40463:1049-1771(+)